MWKKCLLPGRQTFKISQLSLRKTCHSQKSWFTSSSRNPSVRSRWVNMWPSGSPWQRWNLWKQETNQPIKIPILRGSTHELSYLPPVWDASSWRNLLATLKVKSEIHIHQNSLYVLFQNQVKLWSSQLWTQFLQLRRETWKFRTSTGFEPVTSLYRCDALTNWAMKPLTLGAGHLWANSKNCVHNCEDHSFTWFHIRSSYMIHFIYHFIIYSKMAAMLVFFCLIAHWPFWPRSR